MKIASQPILSPSRSSDQYQPPHLLIRRLGLLGGSRRARTRKPAFSVLRRKSTNYAAAAPEPSSPKVTCIGQVRVKSSETAAKARRRIPSFCACVDNWSSTVQRKSKSKKTIWRRFWTAIRGRPVGRIMGTTENKELTGGSDDDDKDRYKVEEVVKPEKYDFDKEKVKELEEKIISMSWKNNPVLSVEEDEERENVEEPTECVPPKNALLLMRCRSAPHRSPVFEDPLWCVETAEESDNRRNSDFCGGGGGGGGGGKEKLGNKVVALPPKEERRRKSGELIDRIRNSTGSIGGNREGLAEESRMDLMGNNKEMDGLILKRCKSEPRTAAAGKLFPEAHFWKKQAGV